MNLANHDLRAWMKEVESIGQLHRIQGVPWDKDMGGLLEMILERSKHPPALLFEKIPDAARTYRSFAVKSTESRDWLWPWGPIPSSEQPISSKRGSKKSAISNPWNRN